MLSPGAFEDRRRACRRGSSALRVVRSSSCFARARRRRSGSCRSCSTRSTRSWADNNYLRTIPLRAPRGVLFDRNGRVLVENRDSFTIAILRERHDQPRTPTIAAARRGRRRATSRRSASRSSGDRAREPLFRPIPVIEHATFAQVAAVAARQLELPEVDRAAGARRAPIPTDGMAAHLFGYVGEIQESQLEPAGVRGPRAGRDRRPGRASSASTTPSCMGADGNRNVVVNSVGREIERARRRTIRSTAARLQLTIDYDLQTALEDAFHAARLRRRRRRSSIRAPARSSR